MFYKALNLVTNYVPKNSLQRLRTQNSEKEKNKQTKDNNISLR